MHRVWRKLPPLSRSQGVSKAYGNVQALRDVSAEVYPGEVLGIVGESGSGKSTLLRMMNLEELPDAVDYRLALEATPGNLWELDRYARAPIDGAPYRHCLPESPSRFADAPFVLWQCGRTPAGRRRNAALRCCARKAKDALDASEFPRARIDAAPGGALGWDAATGATGQSHRA